MSCRDRTAKKPVAYRVALVALYRAGGSLLARRGLSLSGGAVPKLGCVIRSLLPIVAQLLGCAMLYHGEDSAPETDAVAHPSD